MSRKEQIDCITKDLMTSFHGKAIVTLEEAAVFLPWSTSVIRASVKSGELKPVRATGRGKIAFLVRNLAEWILDGQDRENLPVINLKDELDSVRKALEGP